VASALLIVGVAACGSSNPPAAEDNGIGGPSATSGGPGGSSTTGTGDVPGGKCSTEGAVSPCHQEIGRHGSIVTCIDGEMFCYGGTWSQCLVKSGAGVRSVELHLDGIRPQTVAPSPTSCASMPCDPNCQDVTVPGPFVGGGGGGTIVGVSGGFIANSNIPGNCSSTNGGATAYSCSGFMAKTTDPDGVCKNCDKYNNALNVSVTTQACESACQSDQHCTGDGTNSCTAFFAGENTWCTGVDVTVPIGCTDAAGNNTISVCNRGSVDLTSPVDCCQFPGNSPHFADELVSVAASCAGGTLLGTTTGTIAKGTCQTMIINPSGNTSSIICNPHYNAPGVTTPVTLGPSPPTTPTGDSGGWTTVQNVYGAGDASALLGRQTVTNTFDNNYVNGTPDWANFANAQGTANDSSYMTAAVTLSGGTTTAYMLPTTNAQVTTGWFNPANAQSDADTDAYADTAVVVGVANYAGSQTTTNGTGTGHVDWTNAVNATGSPDTNVATNWPGKNSSATMTLAGYGAISATMVAGSVTAKVKDANAASNCTLKIDLVDSAGTVVLANLYNATIGSTSLTDKTYTFSAADLTTLNGNATFLADPRVKITITPPNGNPSANAVSIDSVLLTYQYYPVWSWGNFGFGVPAGSTVTQIDYEARFRNTVAPATSYVKFQAYNGNTPLGAAKTFTPPALTNTLTVYNWSDTGTFSDTQVADGTFNVRVEGGGGNSTQLEYLKARVTYLTGTNNTIVLKNFNLNIPTGAEITSVVTNTNWKTSAATGTLGIQPYVGGAALGTETTAPGSTTAANATNTYTGAITAAQLANGSFEVHLRATGTTAAFTASVDYVSVTVTYQITSASVDLGNFGFSIPTGATVTALTVSLTEKVSANKTAAIQAEAFLGATSTGAVASDTGPKTNYTTVTGTGTSLGSPADYANGNFVVRLTATAPDTDTTSFSALVDSVTATVTYTTSTAGTAKGVPECDDYNNWTAYKKGNSCVNMVVGGSYSVNTLNYDYTPACLPGQRLKWGYLVYDGSTPSAGGSTSSIKFEAQTQVLTPTAGTPSAFVTVADTAAPTNSPAVCPFTGVTGCPIDLSALLPTPTADKLTLKITLTPSCDTSASPCTGTATPTLSSWQVTYDCVDNE
jgi:hypothetical protein